MRRRAARVLTVPVLTAAVLASGNPVVAMADPRPGPSSAPASPSAKGDGAQTPPPFDDGTDAVDETTEASPGLPTGAVTVAINASGWTRAGRLPVLLRADDGTARVRVEVSAGSRVKDAGGGLAVTVQRADHAAKPGRVRVAVDVSGFRQVFRGNWPDRLRVLSVPACELSQGRAPEKNKHCTTAPPVVVLPPTDDPGDNAVEFDASAGPDTETTTPEPDPTASESPAPQVAFQPYASTSGATTYLLAGGPSGSTGSYAATPLAPSERWQVGEHTGAFSTSYPVPLPPPPGGSAPDLSLQYSSQSVDGRTSATNNQASWVGMGWDLSVGSVQRQYGACSADGHPGWGDLCWAKDNATLSLGGTSVPLYRNPTTGKWHAAADSGWRIEHLTGAHNGAHGGEYWKVTDTHGTQFWFGLGHQSVTGTATRSAWTVPVYGDDAGEPCHSTSTSASWCQQAWKWNLDRVVDRNGNASTYFYTPETNYYGRQASPGRATAYIRGGVLSHIDYGQRAGHEDLAAPDRVTFATAYRCATQSLSCAAPTKDTASAYPDVPADLLCAGSYCAGQYSPVFFDTKRLVSVTTSVDARTAYRPVDQVTLTQQFPSPGDHTDPTLWLSSISHRGYANGAWTALPPVRFHGTRLANRVDYNLDLHVVQLFMYRVNKVQGEMGGLTTVAYGRPDPCSASSLPKPAYNTRDCYPAYWVPKSGPAGFGWFHKYLVTSVTVSDPLAHGPDQVTRYAYRGGGAWHYDDDLMASKAQLTWGDWRGYAHVTVTTGSTTRSTTDELFFRGMNGDHLPTGATRTVVLTDSTGVRLADSNWLAGAMREQRQLDTTGAELTGALTGYWAKQTVSGSGLHDAWMVRTSQADDRTRITHPGSTVVTTRTTRTTSAYDSTYGLPTSSRDLGDLATTADDRCASITYARNLSSWILDTVASTIRHAGSCSGTVLGRTETLYDGHTTLTMAPVHGNPTVVRRFSDATHAVTTKAGYDGYGRVISATNGNGHTTRTSYAALYPDGPVTSSKVTNALSQTATVTVDPGRGQPLTTTDANRNTTTLRYDGLGRLVKVWKPSEDTAGVASLRFAYTVSQARPSMVLSQVLQSGSVYLNSWAFLDALGRTVETQVPASGGGRTVTATRYDDRGLAQAVSAALFNPDVAGSGLLHPLQAIASLDTSVSSETRTAYDALARPMRTALVSFGVEKHHTSTSYYGGSIRLTPPVGTATTTYVDARGLTTRVERVLAGKVVPTAYGYTVDGRLKQVKDAAGNLSTYTYDLLGRRRSSHEPDSGTWSTTYDGNGNVRSQTDALQRKVTTLYDQLERPRSRHDGGDTGPLLASWTYDTASHGIGLPRSATSYVGSAAYTSRVDGYDERSRVLGRTWTIPATEGALAGSYSWSYAYDAADHLVSTTEPAAGGLEAETVTTHYDALGFARSLAGAQHYVLSSGFDGEGMLTDRTLGLRSATDPGALRRSYDYDPATRRVTESSATLWPGRVVQNDSVRYDDAGDVTSVTDGATGQTECNSYDGLLRLTHAWTTDEPTCADGGAPHSGVGPDPYNTHWVLRQTGQLASVTDAIATAGHGAGTRTYAYPVTSPPHPHAVGSVTGTGLSARYEYDADGQLTSRTVNAVTTTVSWDREHRVVGLHSPAGDSTNVYDASGARLIHKAGSTSTLALPGLELTDDGASVSAIRTYALAGTAVAQRSTAGGVSWLIGNAQGSTTFTLPANGTPGSSGRQRYSPYGALRTDGQLLSAHGFLGARHDADEGDLQLLGARYYDTSLGRFLSPDPLRQPFSPAASDTYGYSNDNPTTLSDPSGARPACDGPSDCKAVMRDYAQAQFLAAQSRANYADHPDTGDPIVDKILGKLAAANEKYGSFSDAVEEARKTAKNAAKALIGSGDDEQAAEGKRILAALEANPEEAGQPGFLRFGESRVFRSAARGTVVLSFVLEAVQLSLEGKSVVEIITRSSLSTGGAAGGAAGGAFFAGGACELVTGGTGSFGPCEIVAALGAIGGGIGGHELGERFGESLFEGQDTYFAVELPTHLTPEPGDRSSASSAPTETPQPQPEFDPR